MIQLCSVFRYTLVLIIPENIKLIFIPPYTPEMNPIEQIRKEIRKHGFKNEAFQTLQKVIEKLCDTICSLSKDKFIEIACPGKSYPQGFQRIIK